MKVNRDAFFTRPVPAALFLLAFLIVAAAAALSATRALRDRSNLLTGGASWIWHSVDIEEPKPVRFFAGRDFTLARVPPSAKAMVFVDRRGVLTVNGSRFPLPEQGPGSPLAVLEIAPALVAGGNRVVIEAESPTGAGGILFHLDLPGGGRVDSDATWRVSQSQAELARGAGTPAGVWGRPPMYPWGYPRRSALRGDLRLRRTGDRLGRERPRPLAWSRPRAPLPRREPPPSTSLRRLLTPRSIGSVWADKFRLSLR